MNSRKKIDSTKKLNTFINKVLLLIVLVTLGSACSTKKNKFVNRQFHKTTTAYNVLYNGDNSLEKAEEIIVDDYQDDFRKVLPIAPFETGMRAMKGRSHLKKANEKATKAIQKHSMNFGGNEMNKYMDEAYLLLGKTRYYQSKFIPALEAFNFVKLKFVGGDAYYEALLWSAKTQIQIGNYALAVTELESMLVNSRVPKSFKPEIYAHYSDALLQQKKYSSSIKQMKKAIDLEGDARVKTRYAYILAQIYRLDDRTSQSSQTFAKVVEIGTPYKYVLHAKLDRAENFDIDRDVLKKYIDELTEMLDEKRNQDDLDKIYYQIGKIYYKEQYYEKAEENLKMAISAAKAGKYEKGLAYELLGNVNFDQSKYKYAAAYYDSTLTIMSKSYDNYRNVSRKRRQLDNVIKFISISETNDSILKIANMTDGERVDFFEKHIVWLKEYDEIKAAEAVEAARLAEENSSSNDANYTGGARSSFYLYNPVTLEHGRSEFEKRWGDRPLQDQWRILSKPVNTLAAKIDEENENEDGSIEGDNAEKAAKVLVNPLYTVEYYTAQIPSDKDTLKQMKVERDFAYYALGLIYNEQFYKYDLSAKTLEDLLAFKPKKELKLPVYYYLYKNYRSLEYVRKEKEYKEIILSDYPKSRYAEMILNPGEVNSTSEKKKVDLLYESIIASLSERDFRKVIRLSDKFISDYPGNEITPKVELIKAISIGKLGTYVEYKEALEYVMYNFPNDDVSENSKQLLVKLKKEQNSFFDMEDRESARIVILAGEDVDFSKLEKSLAKIIWKKLLKTELSSYSFTENAFVIYNFKSWEAAEDFKKEYLPKSLIRRDLGVKNTDTFIISRDNFNILQRKKNTELYLKKYK
ncbi:MAG: hypothetical protein KAH10_04905 [Flavobacteriales bacterium]|nr:hypothetical protein [Flavobacteriales bacterium]